jgi:DNA-binding NtrC family response regulator
MSMSNRTILVVDDETPQRDLMRSILHLEAYSVLEASDYDDVLNVQAEHLGEIDLVLIDLRLPGGHGYDLCMALHAVEPHLKALFVSGLAGAELCKFFAMHKADVHFLQKPFQPADLLWHVKTVLELSDPLAGNASAD